MIYSTLTGAYNVNLMPIDITLDSVTFSASAHTVDPWYVTIKNSKSGTEVIHHTTDSDYEILNPMFNKTNQVRKLDTFASAIAKSLMKREKTRSKRMETA